MNDDLPRDEDARSAEDGLVSVVIANWNRRDDLRETLLRYQAQTYPYVEIVVVDNGSTDGAVTMISEEFPAVRLIALPENRGVEAYNLGLKAARGEIVVVSDNDSWLEPEGIEKILRKFKEGGPRLAVVACEIVYPPRNAVYEWYQHPVDRRAPRPEGYPAHLFIGAGAALRRRVLEQVGYYPEEFFFFMNEVDLCTRIIGAGYDVRYFPDVVAFHKLATKSRARTLGPLLSFRNIIWYYWKYFPLQIALGRSLIRIPFDMLLLTVKGVPFPATLRTLRELLGGIPAIVRTRRPIPRNYVRRALGDKSEIANLWAYCAEILRRRARERSG